MFRNNDAKVDTSSVVSPLIRSLSTCSVWETFDRLHREDRPSRDAAFHVEHPIHPPFSVCCLGLGLLPGAGLRLVRSLPPTELFHVEQTVPRKGRGVGSGGEHGTGSIVWSDAARSPRSSLASNSRDHRDDLDPGERRYARTCKARRL